MIQPKVLIVDDDEVIVSLVTDVLEKEKFTVISACNTDDGYKRAINSQPDVIVLDIKMPKVGGIELCRMLRAEPRTKKIPIIMLTVESTETDKVIGLEVGADDYVSKPFGAKEFVARVRALIRRVERHNESSDVIKSGTLEIDVVSRTVKMNKKELYLRPKEFDLLVVFIKKPNTVLTRQYLLESVFGYSVPIPSRTVDTHIKNLRSKLGTFGKKIKTAVGYGFKFTP